MARRLFSLVLAGALIAAAPVQARQRELSEVTIKTEKVADGVWMLVGAGGNIGVSAGPDGALLIDGQYPSLTGKIKAAVAALGDQPIRFLLDTHWHGDHVSGNENFGKAGALIIAHDNVRARMSAEQFSKLFDRTVPPAPKAALPVVTFNDTMTFHLNGETIVAFHAPPGHTDGDAIVRFTRAGVVHLGDCFFNGTYPVIDVSAGGSIGGMIAVADLVLGQIGEGTKLIPGHGPLGDKASFQAFRDMLVTARDRIRPLVEAGKTEDEVVTAKPTAELDAKWGRGFMTPEMFVRTVCSDLVRAVKAEEAK